MAIETLQYVYQLGDFATTGGNIRPPDESGATAAGSPPFTLMLNPGAGFQQLQVNDLGNDGLDEVNSANQTLNAPITLDGVTYPAGTRVFVNYVLETAGGVRVYSITIGGANSGNNATTAIIAEQPLVPGQQYVFVSEANIGAGEVPYSVLACFGAGTLIDTASGARPVEVLRPGDRIRTADHGLQPLRWVCTTRVAALGRFAPVVLADGALGNRGVLVLSPSHRLLVGGPSVELATGLEEALVAARHLVNGSTIRRREGGWVRYFHLVFDAHEIVFSNGIPSESFFPGAIESLASEAMAEFDALFPDYRSGPAPVPARPSMRRHEAAFLA